MIDCSIARLSSAISSTIEAKLHVIRTLYKEWTLFWFASCSFWLACFGCFLCFCGLVFVWKSAICNSLHSHSFTFGCVLLPSRLQFLHLSSILSPIIAITCRARLQIKKMRAVAFVAFPGWNTSGTALFFALSISILRLTQTFDHIKLLFGELWIRQACFCNFDTFADCNDVCCAWLDQKNCQNSPLWHDQKILWDFCCSKLPTESNSE